MNIKLLKTGRKLLFNANGCDPNCKECTRSHTPLKVVVIGNKVHTFHTPGCDKHWLCPGNVKVFRGRLIHGGGSKIKKCVARLHALNWKKS